MTGTAAANKQHLEQLIEEAIVDCYGEEEQATGLFTMIEENLALPFKTTILGIEADVVSVDLDDDDRLAAVCKAGKHRQRIALADLPLPSPAPAGPMDRGLPVVGEGPALTRARA
jgi:phosphopantothenate synthetase